MIVYYLNTHLISLFVYLHVDVGVGVGLMSCLGLSSSSISCRCHHHHHQYHVIFVCMSMSIAIYSVVLITLLLFVLLFVLLDLYRRIEESKNNLKVILQQIQVMHWESQSKWSRWVDSERSLSIETADDIKVLKQTKIQWCWVKVSVQKAIITHEITTNRQKRKALKSKRSLLDTVSITWRDTYKNITAGIKSIFVSVLMHIGANFYKKVSICNKQLQLQQEH